MILREKFIAIQKFGPHLNIKRDGALNLDIPETTDLQKDTHSNYKYSYV